MILLHSSINLKVVFPPFPAAVHTLIVRNTLVFHYVELFGSLAYTYIKWLQPLRAVWRDQYNVHIVIVKEL